MRRALALALAASTATLVACTQHDIDHAGSSLESAAPALANDGVLVARVEARLLRIDPGSALHVAVASHDGDVRLSGKVKTAATLARYAAAARSLPGVKHVAVALAIDPRLAEAPGAVSDFALAAAVRTALIGQGGVNAIALDVQVHGGQVVLAGTVHSAAVRTTLVDAARGTRGVKGVDDRLEVRP